MQYADFEAMNRTEEGIIASIREEFLNVNDYDEFDIRRLEFSVLGTKDEDVMSHLYYLFDTVSGNKPHHTNCDNGFIVENFETTVNIVEAECAAGIARETLATFREENNIYENETKMTEYKSLVKQLAAKIKKIRNEGSRDTINIHDVEEYKKMWLRSEQGQEF